MRPCETCASACLGKFNSLGSYAITRTCVELLPEGLGPKSTTQLFVGNLTLRLFSTVWCAVSFATNRLFLLYLVTSTDEDRVPAPEI